MKGLIFKNIDNIIEVVRPFPEGQSMGLIELGKRAVPAELPFWIIDLETLPDKEFQAAWELDGTEGEPDGYGEEND